MVSLMPLPDQHGPLGQARLWINPTHITTAIAHVDQPGEEWRLTVELKLQGLPSTRNWLETGTREHIDQAWSTFLKDLADHIGN